ncbi:MAG TPA: hypothetical protein QF753_18725 [Victivallales bacterium]|nr:hypothetical protein [Victivallales bacterium]
MKSAYELAMERAGVESVKKLTDVQKQKISELDAVSKSKIAEAKLTYEDKKKRAAGDISALNQISEDLVVELASINSKYEREKDKIRNS